MAFSFAVRHKSHIRPNSETGEETVFSAWTGNHMFLPATLKEGCSCSSVTRHGDRGMCCQMERSHSVITGPSDRDSSARICSLLRDAASTADSIAIR